MKEKNLTKISLRTVPNGYTLTVNDTECMYFNEIDLIAGFLAHVGFQESKNLEKGTILSMLFSAMMGQEYADNVTVLKQRVGLLTSQYQATIDRMDKAIEYVTQAEKTISGLMNRLGKIETALKGTEQDHAQNKKVVDDTAKKLADIDAKANKVMDSLANSATILKAMEEAGDAAKGKSNGKKKDEEPDKSETAAKSDGEPKKKGRGGRNKAADAAVAAEIEKKAKANPNIK